MNGSGHRLFFIVTKSCSWLGLSTQQLLQSLGKFLILNFTEVHALSQYVTSKVKRYLGANFAPLRFRANFIAALKAGQKEATTLALRWLDDSLERTELSMLLLFNRWFYTSILLIVNVHLLSRLLCATGGHNANMTFAIPHIFNFRL